MADLTPLKIIAFPGAPNLPLFAAIELGLFPKAGLAAELSTTASSVYQFEQFGAGAFDIAFTAYDNVVAYDEGQGAAKLPGPPDFRVVMGAAQTELSLVVAPGLKPADLKGKSLALDAVNTGFAFVHYAMLDKLGLKEGDYERVAVGATPDRWTSVKDGVHAATMTIEPFTSIARAAGFQIMSQSTGIFPAYQGGIVAARKAWIDAHPGPLKAFIGVYLDALDWTLNPANAEAAATLLQANMPDIKPQALGPVMKSLLSPRTGLTPKAAILPDGMRAVLALRSRYGKPGPALTDIDKYLALDAYEAAIRIR